MVFEKGRAGGKEGESDPSADVFDTSRFLESLKEYQYSIPYTINAKPYLQYEQEKSGAWQMELEKVGCISYVDAFEGDNGEISVSDEESDLYNGHLLHNEASVIPRLVHTSSIVLMVLSALKIHMYTR